MPPSREQLLKTGKEFIEAYGEWTLDAITAHRSPDCVQHTLPTTRQQPSRSNQEYRDFFAKVLPLYQNFKATVDDDNFVDVEQRKVFMHVRSRADTVIGEYKNEYMFVVKITEAGDKVQEVWEFVDTAHSADFSSRLITKVTQATV